MKHVRLLLAVSVLMLFTYCNKGEDYQEATIEHMGFDFSANTSPGDSDGECINWYPGGGSHPTYSSGVWYRNDQNGLQNEQHHLGNVDMEDITSIPTSWDDVITPLLVDHVYVVKCHDGYALFKVLSTNESDMSAKVEFVFSEDGKFNE